MAKTTSVAEVKPEPCSVIACPGLADASDATAGVPLAAVADTDASDTPKAAPVPPAVVTVIGP